MKHLIIILTCLFIISSCGEEEAIIFDGNQVGLNLDNTSILLLEQGPVNPGIEVHLIAQPKSSPTNVNFQINDATTAIEGLHYNAGGSTVVIPANENVSVLPIEILTQNFASNEEVTFDITITGGDNVTPSDYSATGVISVTVICESNLAGSMSYTQTNIWCGAPDISGATNIVAISDNEYKIDDFAFGAYVPCYGSGAVEGSNPAISLRMVDNCNNISMAGVDVYGDSWIYEVAEVNGSSLTINWSNTYGESGTVTLTRDDGANWPALTN